ncbi:MAG: hypothetical protein A3B38_03085 [Candidatus Levybacteria bacterium RIFCSPLOWO2_01_FULL_36_13]|nr:MAG: hypothetical protein A2684_04175 [Candidatus Levybacteria bacterium RIFCSPHIGHO2_01_FULL_36_15b]OGH35875.1 MAG: hypothetical protein A3B38_03085 [Candidatus Levybacteria bacterium RIFCSPLOWO2_01_FULL_36_13]
MEENNTQQNSQENISGSTSKPLIHSFGQGKTFTPKIIALLGLIVVLGVISGYMLSGKGINTSVNTSTSNKENQADSGTIVGSNDIKTFKDTVEGVLKEGGIEDEGAFHLERSGGESQNVYLTSSIVDLSQFVGKKIKVWGQTQKAQYAGWLMDVGKIEVL